MKHLLILVLALSFSINTSSQSTNPQERIIEIAHIENNTIKILDYSISDLRINSKISWILDLRSKDFDLMNPKVLNEPGKGWYLQFEFSTPLYAGIYKEKLQLKNNKLIITETRSAMMAKATNCNVIVFSDDENHCKCINKKDETIDSDLTYRLFSSIH